MMRTLLSAGLALACNLALELTPAGATLKLDATRLFQESVTENIRLSPDKQALELETGELFEDDGPAAGHSYKEPKNQEVLSPTTWIKKDLIVPNPKAIADYLVVLSDGQVEAAINGHWQTTLTNQSGRQGYKVFPFEPALLKAGRNDFVLRGTGSVMVARSDEFALGSRTRIQGPKRSARSSDKGKTWSYDRLGSGGLLQGEYGVRLFLDHYRPHGALTGPVIDLGNLTEKPIGSVLTELGPMRIHVEAQPGAAGKVRVRVRSGTTYAVNEQSWTAWKDLGKGGGVLSRPHGRFVQVAVDLTTSDGLETPTLASVELSNSLGEARDWVAGVQVQEQHNEQVVRSSIPFQYEPLDQPHLKQLRQQYHLDNLVKGATNELELMLRLAQWACNAWDWPNHITEQYPPWDALDILKPYPDGTPTGGFCQQFNLVFLQACESFGFNGRAISISQGRLQSPCPGGGHEIVELWSNDFHKWVYVDGALAWYIMDAKSRIPLSMLELRDRQLALRRGENPPPVEVIKAERTRNKQFDWNGLWPKPLNWYFELRMIPRSNFLQEKSPLPLNQGTEEWAWTGHYVWTDEEVPAGLLFGNRVTKRSDFEWTLNQAHYLLEPTKEPGTFQVHLDTVTPSLETFVAQIDSGTEKAVSPGFDWRLHEGKNQLRVKTRNVAGREGVASWITLNYQPAMK